MFDRAVRLSMVLPAPGSPRTTSRRGESGRQNTSAISRYSPDNSIGSSAPGEARTADRSTITARARSLVRQRTGSGHGASAPRVASTIRHRLADSLARSARAPSSRLASSPPCARCCSSQPNSGASTATTPGTTVQSRPRPSREAIRHDHTDSPASTADSASAQVSRQPGVTLASLGRSMITAISRPSSVVSHRWQRGSVGRRAQPSQSPH
jgi:hypothetical protein